MKHAWTAGILALLIGCSGSQPGAQDGGSNRGNVDSGGSGGGNVDSGGSGGGNVDSGGSGGGNVDSGGALKFSCTTSADKGECGPYTYPQIEGLGSGNQDKLQVGNNVWAPINGASQTLHANNPGDWMVTADMPDGNTSVVSYPSVGADYHVQDSSGNWVEQPLSNFSSMVSSFSESMNATSRTSAWAAYDIWLNQGKNEVMIQHDFAKNGGCTSQATATFGGSHNVPMQNWHLCKFGSELVWKLGTDDSHKINEPSGSVDILAMLTWLEDHGYIPQNSTLGLIGYGWEICSTGGVNESFKVASFSITAP